MKRVPRAVLIASGSLFLGLALAPPGAKALCLASATPSPCSRPAQTADSQRALSGNPILRSAGSALRAALAPAAGTVVPASASLPPVGPTITYSLRDRETVPAQLSRPSAAVNVTGTMGPMVKVRYQIDAAAPGALEHGDGLQIVIDNPVAGLQEMEAEPGSGGAMPLAEPSRPSYRPSLSSSEEDEFYALAPLALLGAGAALVLTARPRDSMRPGM